MRTAGQRIGRPARRVRRGRRRADGWRSETFEIGGAGRASCRAPRDAQRTNGRRRTASWHGRSGTNVGPSRHCGYRPHGNGAAGALPGIQRDGWRSGVGGAARAARDRSTWRPPVVARYQRAVDNVERRPRAKRCRHFFSTLESLKTESTMGLKRARRLLVIDDDPALAEALRVLLEHAGYEVKTAPDGRHGEDLFRTWRPDGIVTDMILPDIDGIELVRTVKRLDATAEVIVITGQGNVVRAVEAVKAGAFDFLEKPVDPDRLLDKLEKALRGRILADENEQLKQRLRDRYGFTNIIGTSQKM